MDINKSVSSLGLSCSNNVKGDETISKIEDLKDAVMCNIKTIDTDEKTMYESELLPQLSNIMKDAESSIPSLCDIENKLSKQNASLQSLYESFDAAITTHNDNINDLARKRGTLLSELKTNNSQQLHCNQTNIQSLQNKFHMFHNQSLQHISYLKTLIKQQATQNKLLQTQIENQNNLGAYVFLLFASFLHIVKLAITMDSTYAFLQHIFFLFGLVIYPLTQFQITQKSQIYETSQRLYTHKHLKY